MRVSRIVALVVVLYVGVAIFFSCGVKPEDKLDVSQEDVTVSYSVINQSSQVLFINSGGKVTKLDIGDVTHLPEGDIFVILNNKSYLFSLTEDLLITDSLLDFLLLHS